LKQASAIATPIVLSLAGLGMPGFVGRRRRD
jgi:uncharacterized protein (TIGR03382 family)